MVGVTWDELQAVLLGGGVIAGALTVIATAFAKVPPLRAIVGFFGERIFGPAGRAIVREPLADWFQRELRKGVEPLLNHSVRREVGQAIGKSVPAAVRTEMAAQVVPQLEATRRELVAHMLTEEAQRAELIEANGESAEAVREMRSDIRELRSDVRSLQQREGGHVEPVVVVAGGVWLGLTALAAGTTDYSGIALVIVAIGSLITAVGGVVVAIMVNRVHQEVKTFNDKSLGQLGAEGETRRAVAIPHDDRTVPEQKHIDDSPPPDPPQGPGR